MWQGGHRQQRYVSDVVAADRDRDESFRAVERVDLWRLAVLAVGQHMGGGGTGVGDVDEVEAEPLRHQMRIVGRRPACP